MNSLAKAQPMKPQQGKVSTQAHTMRRATPQFTRRKLFEAVSYTHLTLPTILRV